MSKVGDDIKPLYDGFRDEYLQKNKTCRLSYDFDKLYDYIDRMRKKDIKKVNKSDLPLLIAWIDNKELKKLLDHPKIDIEHIYSYDSYISGIGEKSGDVMSLLKHICNCPTKIKILINHGFDIHRNMYVDSIWPYRGGCNISLVEYINKLSETNEDIYIPTILGVLTTLADLDYDMEDILTKESFNNLSKYYPIYKKRSNQLKYILKIER